MFAFVVFDLDDETGGGLTNLGSADWWLGGCDGCDALLGKSWDEIIPAGERQKVDEEELHQQLVALNPPPRSRKTVNKSAVSAAAAAAVFM